MIHPATAPVAAGSPLLSVILPVRDPDPAALARCLASFDALANARSLELIVVYTGSFEPAMCSGFTRLGNLLVAECTAQGIYAAFNTGIDLSSGRFLLFFGHDDIALPDMDHALGCLAGEADGPTLVACSIYVQGMGVRKPSRFRQGIVFRNWGHQAIFYAREIFRERRYDLRYPLRADHRLNIALLADPRVRCVRRSWTVSYFSRGGFSSKNITDAHFDAEQATIAGREFGWPWGIAVLTLLPLVRCARKIFHRPGKPALRSDEGSGK